MFIQQFEAWVAVDGERNTQEEYDLSRDKDEDVETWSCLVESELGKTFSVICLNFDQECAVHGTLKIDGQKLAEGVILPGRDQINFMTLESVMVANGQNRPFMFTKTVTTESNECDLNPADIGLIELTLREIHGVKSSRSSLSKFSFSDEYEDEHKIPERLKPSPHIVGFGEPRPCQPTQPAFDITHSSPGELLARFRFRYQPLDLIPLRFRSKKRKPVQTSNSPEMVHSSSPAVKVEESDELQTVNPQHSSESEPVEGEVDDDASEPDLELLLIPKEGDEDDDMDELEPDEEAQIQYISESVEAEVDDHQPDPDSELMVIPKQEDNDDDMEEPEPGEEAQVQYSSESVKAEVDDHQPDLDSELMAIPKEEDKDVDMLDGTASDLLKLRSEIQACTQTLSDMQRRLKDLEHRSKEVIDLT